MYPTGLFPRAAPRPTTSHAEQVFHSALASGLPDGWTAWHSLRVRTAQGMEGEGDFVIAIPDRGVLVVEVKGGAVEARNGVWLQNGRQMDRAPREQAHGYRQRLLKKLEETHTGPTPWIGIATAFPETPFTTGPTQGDIAGAVLGKQDLPYLREALPALADRAFVGARPPQDSRWIESLHALWGETWTPRLALGQRARLREEELVALDEEQLSLLDHIDSNARMLVLGGPGTGKTLLARDMAGRMAASGKHPVLLCWTRALAMMLRAGGMQDVWAVREYAADLLARAGTPAQGGASQEDWTPETWELIPLQATMDALPVVGTPYDSVVVDEAQDFSSYDWDFVRAIASSGTLWAFADSGQRFWEDRAWPADLFPTTFSLRKRYRCPEPLARFADSYRADAGGGTLPSSIDGLRIVRAPSPSALGNKVALEIQKALGDGASPSGIAVISLSGQTRTEVCAGTHIGRHTVVRADDPTAPDHVVADSFLRFKGLERPWVIVTELSLGRSRYDVRMHVSLTRATVGCVVVATAEEIAADARLSAAVV